jgi:hypothetical protein
MFHDFDLWFVQTCEIYSSFTVNIRLDLHSSKLQTSIFIHSNCTAMNYASDKTSCGEEIELQSKQGWIVK